MGIIVKEVRTIDASDLYTLAMRLLPRRTRRGGPGGVPPADLELHAGELPPGLPFELPVPASCRIIGATVERPFVTVLLDTDLTPRDALTFYKGSLAAGGWRMLETYPSRGGFEVANHSHGLFCRTPLGPKLTLNAHAYPDELTEVRLDLDLTPDTPCEYVGRPRPPHPAPVPSLPELASPAGAALETGGGEASPFGTSAQAVLTTTLDLGSVSSHYAEQMRRAGCVERDRGQGDLVAWSTWELDHPDHGPSQGLVLVMRQLNAPNRYFLYVRVAWSAVDSASSPPFTGSSPQVTL